MANLKYHNKQIVSILASTLILIGCHVEVKEVIGEAATVADDTSNDTDQTTDETTNTSDTSSDSESATSTIPENLIAAFDATSCPSGWEVFSAGQGRVLLGAGSGNSDSDANPLTDRTLGATGGLEYKNAIPYALTGGSNTTAGRYLGVKAGTGVDTLYYDQRDPTVGLGATSVDSNFSPFRAYLICIKTSSVVSIIPDNIILPQDSSSCSTNWTQEASLNGRTLLGSGSGNTDANSDALTGRTIGDVGGREESLGWPTGTGATNRDTPGLGWYPGTLADATIYTAAAPGSGSVPAGCPALGAYSLNCKIDSNIPPFISLPYCQVDSEITADSLPSNTVAGFNSSTCPSGWSEFGDGNGRIIIGIGTGNTDVDGSAIATKNYGDTGGYENSNSLRLGLAAASANTPTGNRNISLADPGGATFANATGPDVYSDTFQDSNLPPFVVVQYCVKN